ncbi:MAG: HK97-gp10 family putative phage morphogenesis protein [Methanobrevibacter sp.]|uniref:HK97-gp10 family putative phage morphogenesis protein n=1 Tax=Methanobrevibacter sp. TaxID=66852 RepID=UPI003F0BE7F7
MVKVQIKVDTSKMPNLTEEVPKIIKKGLNYTGQGMLRQLKINSPVDTGYLKGWFFSKTSGEEIEIRTPAKYASFVNDGTGIYGPHNTPIYSKSIGKPLAFQIGGKTVFVKMVKGQKPQKFVEKSIAQTEDKLEGYFIKAAHEVLQ